MSRPHGIFLLGANGSGKSTLGRELARAWNFTHFDVEDYWFYKTYIPYTAIRPKEERNGVLFSHGKKHEIDFTGCMRLLNKLEVTK